MNYVIQKITQLKNVCSYVGLTDPICFALKSHDMISNMNLLAGEKLMK